MDAKRCGGRGCEAERTQGVRAVRRGWAALGRSKCLTAARLAQRVGDRPTDRGGEASAVLGTLDFYVVGSEAPLKSFEFREGETDENRVGFCKDYSATSAGCHVGNSIRIWGLFHSQVRGV